MKVGAIYRGDGECLFRVWAPFADKMELKITSPEESIVPMESKDNGYWALKLDSIEPGTKYLYVIDGELERPDPASAFQPEGVHGASAVYDHHGVHKWNDMDWNPPPLEKMIIYELHVGAFSPEGNFAGVEKKLDYLAELGVNAIELMPVFQFPGNRNWGYDCAYTYAIQDSYGGPAGLMKLVDAAHGFGIAVILDVVYSHFGPEGNYLNDFGPYFTDKYKTPWGASVNLDGPYSDNVRNFFIENALFLSREFHADGLRIGAVHEMVDTSAKPFLMELAENVKVYKERTSRSLYLLADSNLNDTGIIKPLDDSGYGFDGQWLDDFHHSLHSILTGEQRGIFEDYGGIEHMDKALSEGFVYSWDYSRHRKQHFGSSSLKVPARRFIAYAQNHAQIGTRTGGERLSRLVDFESLKLAAGALMLSHYIPMIFMGQEYAEDEPFLSFLSYTDKELINRVRHEREAELVSFDGDETPPDPFDRKAFDFSKLQWNKIYEPRNKLFLEFYRELIRLRNNIRSLSFLSKSIKALHMLRFENRDTLVVKRVRHRSETALVLNFEKRETRLAKVELYGKWRKVIDSADEKWEGPGSPAPETFRTDGSMTLAPRSFVLYERTGI